MDRFRKFRLPPRSFELDSDLDRGCILELTNGTALAEITVLETQEAETRQRNGRDDGGTVLTLFSLGDHNLHVVGGLEDTSDCISEQSTLPRILREGIEHRSRESQRAPAAK